MRFVEAGANSAVHPGLAKGARSVNDGGAHRKPGARADANEARARLERDAAALAARLEGK
jgi:hypothetical protein